MTTSPTFPNATILLVDSTSPDVSAFARLLEQKGYRVIVEHHGEAALERATTEPPDLILLDVIMPGMDGFETCRRLKRSRGTAAIPVIFMTALGDTTETVNAFAAGAADYVTRPLDINEVVERIQTHLGVSAMRNQLAALEPSPDILTKRAMLCDRLQLVIAQAHRQQKLVALLRVDIRDWKQFSAGLSYEVGEQLLRAVASRVQSCLRESDTVARVGSGEFAIVVADLSKSYNAAIVADKVIEAMNKTFDAAGGAVHLNINIGIGLYPADGVGAETLLNTAEMALERAVKNKRDYQFYTAALNFAAQERLDLIRRLSQAISRRELVVHYQPQLEIETGNVVAVEALLRWRNGERVVTCDEFISVAEESGLIVPMGEWLLREACMNFARWRDAGRTDLRLALNFSLRQMDHPDFVERIKRVLDQTGVPASALDIEITESLLMRQVAQNMTTLERLAAMGAQIAIDDFGAGPYGLSCLRHFRVNALKIDRSLVAGIGRDSADETAMVAILAMARGLNLRLVAEGVESDRQVAFLREHGCAVAQGFYFGRPVPAEAMTHLLKAEVPLPAAAANQKK